MATEFICTLRRMGRFYPPDREVLRDVTLAFLQGAKIGVIGHNGSGKSTLLRITGLDGAREVNGRAFVASFNFTGSDQQKRVGDLAGGERNRVHLARTLTSGCNVLLLDEPTNGLDVDTLRALEAALESFGGCAVVISHDRWFLDRIATHVLAFEGNSEVRWFEGSFSEYETFRKSELAADAGPTRIAYKPLAR